MRVFGTRRQRLAGDNVGHQPPVAQGVLALDHHGIANLRVLAQPCLDRAHLEADPAILDLWSLRPSNSIVPSAHQRPRSPVWYRRSPGEVEEGLATVST